MDWTQTYPGIPAMVPATRAFVRGLLAETPCHEAAELIASELAANAIRHTPSGWPGGSYLVRVRQVDTWARVEVTDAGRVRLPHEPRDAQADEEYGRGIAIVKAIATKFGEDSGPSGKTVWAELEWSNE